MELTEEELSGGSPPVGGERMVSPLTLPSSSSSSIPSSVPIASATTPPPYTTIVTSKTPPCRSYLEVLVNAESQECSPPSIISPPWETFDLLGLDLAAEVPVAAVRELIYLSFDALGEGPFVEKWEKEKLELLERLEALADDVDLDEVSGGKGPMLDIFNSTAGLVTVGAVKDNATWEDGGVLGYVLSDVESENVGWEPLTGRQFPSEERECSERPLMSFTAGGSHGYRSEHMTEGAAVRSLLDIPESAKKAELKSDLILGVGKIGEVLGVAMGWPSLLTFVAGEFHATSSDISQRLGDQWPNVSLLGKSPGGSCLLMDPAPPPTGIGTEGWGGHAGRSCRLVAGNGAAGWPIQSTTGGITGLDALFTSTVTDRAVRNFSNFKFGASSGRAFSDLILLKLKRGNMRPFFPGVLSLITLHPTP